MSWLFFWRKKQNGGTKVQTAYTNNQNKARTTFSLASLFRRNNVQGFKIYKEEELHEVDPYAPINNNNKAFVLPEGATFDIGGKSNEIKYQDKVPPPVPPRKNRGVFQSIARSFQRLNPSKAASSTPRTGQVKDRIKKFQGGKDNNTREWKENRDPLRFNKQNEENNENKFEINTERQANNKYNSSGVPSPEQPHWKLKKKGNDFKKQKPVNYEVDFKSSKTVTNSYSNKVTKPKQVFSPRQFGSSTTNTNTSVTSAVKSYDNQYKNKQLPTIYKKNVQIDNRSTKNSDVNSSVKSIGLNAFYTPNENKDYDTEESKRGGKGTIHKNQETDAMSDKNLPQPPLPYWQKNNKPVLPQKIKARATPKHKRKTNTTYDSKSKSYGKGLLDKSGSSDFNSSGRKFENQNRFKLELENPNHTKQRATFNSGFSTNKSQTNRSTNNTFNGFNSAKPKSGFKSNQSFKSSAKPLPPSKPVRQVVSRAPPTRSQDVVMQSRETNLRASIKGMKGLASFWDDIGTKNIEKQEFNPFSDKFNGKRQVASGNLFGSKSDERAKKAQEWTNKEIDRVVQVIKDYGSYDSSTNSTMITFGELFLIYENISDTLVFMLLKARKRNRIHFDGGEMLLQGKDDHVKIYVRN